MGDSSELWSSAGKSLEFQGNMEGATECYERARKYGDETPETLLNLAISYFRLYEFSNSDKYLEAAKACLLSGVEKDSENPKFRHYLGLVYLGLGEKALAMQEFFHAAEREAEQAGELLMHFELPGGAPEFYDVSEENVYDLLPDPALYKMFDLLKSFPLDSSLFQSLRDTYGEKSSLALAALYLRSVYYKIFEDRSFSGELGLSSDEAKWEAVLVFFVRGINDESRSLVRKALGGGKPDISQLPPYTRLLINRYKREILSSASEKDSMKALTALPMRKLEALDRACEIAEGAKGAEDAARNIGAIMDVFMKLGLAARKGGNAILSPSMLEGSAEAGRIAGKLGAREYDRELFILLSDLFRKKRFEYALDLAKKIRALYDENEAAAHIKAMLSRIGLSEEEKIAILSEA